MLSDFAGWAAGLMLLIFCGAGVYWLCLAWFQDPVRAIVASIVIPIVLIWLFGHWIIIQDRRRGN